ncbi:MAG: hypothetical protein GXY67_10410 [Clostridiales bacterium]|nr:hypothetical protein [Clostridiales bacterium]
MAEWIHRDERLPTAEDADAYGCVLVWHTFNGHMITGWHQLPSNRYFTHWMPTPCPPENAQAGWDGIKKGP